VLDNVKTVVEIISSSLTATAVVVGGIWAYFKFVKGRTYRPRLDVTILGQWREVGGMHFLWVRVVVKNIGASVVELLQKGTGLRLSILAPEQPEPPAPTTWSSLKVFAILGRHDWVEPGETVSDDILLSLGPGPQLVLAETRLVWSRKRGDANIVVFARTLITTDAAIGASKDAIPD
jgi:hypothetical protein